MTDADHTKSGDQSTILPMAMIAALFFIFGFVTWLNGSLMPFLKAMLDLSKFQAFWVTFAFYIAYTVLALPVASILSKVGYRHGMMIGLAVMAAGALLFIPAALSLSYAVFLLALFTLGAGLTFLQTASNPYVVLLGPKESAATRISIMGILNKFAGVLAPLVFTALVLSGLGDSSEDAIKVLSPEAKSALAGKLIMPYIYVAIGLLVLASFVKFASLPHVEPEEPADFSARDGKSVLAYPQLVLGAIALFFYMAVEVIAGDSIGLFGGELQMQDATSLTSYVMGFMVVGYILGVVTIPSIVSQQSALLASAVVGILCAISIAFSSPESTAIADFLLEPFGLRAMPDPVFFVALMGLANALVWPAIWPLALDGLGKHTSQGSAILIMAIAGGALVPPLFGLISHSVGSYQPAYWLCLPCYAVILLYACLWHKKRSW